MANTSIVNVTMKNTLGYTTNAFNTLGAVNFTDVCVLNTTFENDDGCISFDYNNLMLIFHVQVADCSIF